MPPPQRRSPPRAHTLALLYAKTDPHLIERRLRERPQLHHNVDAAFALVNGKGFEPSATADLVVTNDGTEAALRAKQAALEGTDLL